MPDASDFPRSSNPGQPNFRLPKFRRPSKGRMLVTAVIGLILALVFSARGLSGFYVNLLWFDSLGRGDVYWGILRSKSELVLIFTLGSFLFLWVNMLVADKVAPLSLPSTPEDMALMRVREATAGSRGKLRIAVALVISLMLGLPTAGEWQQWIMFRHRQAFSTGDPLFRANVGFYVFRLPFAQFVVSWAFGALMLVTIVVTAFHFLNGSIRPQDRVQRVTPQAKVHLSVLFAAAALLRAADYFLDKYALTSSERGVVRGALYTDVKAQLPALNLMILVSLAVTALLLWNIRQRGWRMPVIAVGLWVVVALVAGTAYPAVVQRFIVQPNVSTREIPYIKRNMTATKAALGIADVQRVPTAFQDITAADVQVHDASLRDVRQLDPAKMTDRFTLDQGLASYYSVKDLDVDRYTVDGRVQQVLVATRELNPDGLPNKTWVSRHLIYTHGCGLIAAPASVATEDGRPSYIDLPTKNPLVYFGDRLSGYAVVGTSQKEQPCPNTKAAAYTGTGGIRVDSLLKRVALAVNFGEFNLFGSNLITEKSQMLLERDVRSRVQKVAPFLHFDSDPYPVAVDGDIKWVVDAFTTTDRYPYAQTADVSHLSAGSGLDHRFNYVRNSVKAVVDAYTGAVTLYIVDTKDPIIRTWASAFPDLFTPKSRVPAALAAHFRYPEDLFRVQSNIFGRYQFSDPNLFFNRNAAWSVAQAPPTEPEGSSASGATGTASTLTPGIDSIDTTDSGGERFSPYYSIFHAPGSTTDVGLFSMVRPFVPFSSDDSRKELRSVMVVSSDPKSYGRITIYDIKAPLPPGPATVAAEFESEPTISQTITPLDQRGSRVEFGDLQLVPVGKGLVFIRPLFVLPDNTDSKQIFVRKVLASYNGNSVIGDGLTSVIAQLFPGFNMNLGDRVGGTNGGSPTTTVPGGSGGSTTTTVPSGMTPAQMLAQAESLFKEADAALAKSPPDFATYQSKQAQARALLARALAAVR